MTAAAARLDDQTSAAIRQALAAASAGQLGEACRIGEEALASGGDPAALNAMLGMFYRRLGRLDDATRSLRIAHGARPTDPVIAANLATALAEDGNFEGAAAVLTDQVAHPGAPVQIHRLRGYVAQSLEHYPTAVAAYERVVAAEPDDWESWNNLGNARTGAGDAAGSVAALQRAAEIRPGAVPVRLNLAMALGRAGDPAGAERMLRSLADDEPGEPRPLVELHALLKEQGREEEALAAIEAAVRRDPGNLELLLALASQSLLQLRNEAAEAAYRRVIERDPQSGIAHLGLAVVFELTNRTEALAQLVDDARSRGAEAGALNFIRAFHLRREKRFSEALAALEQVPEELETARRWQLLGQLRDALGDYAPAFDAFSRMNRLNAEHPTRPVANGARYREGIGSWTQQTAGKWAAGWVQHKLIDGRSDPAFLVGIPRSGTTLLDTMLMGHPDVEVLEEEPALRDAGKLLPELAEMPTASAEQTRAARDAYFRTAASLTPLAPGNRLVDKNPLSMNMLPAIHRLFPKSPIILALRHPCDVVLSCFITNFRLNEGMASFLRLDTAAELYDLSFRYFEHVRQSLPVAVHEIRYEDVVEDSEGQLRPLLQFLGLPWDEKVVDHEATARARGRIKTASYAQVTEPLYRRSAGRWQHYRKQMEPVLPILAPWAEKFGYAI